MAFMSAIGYRLWMADASSANDSHPTSSTNLTEILNLTNAGIEGTTETQTVIDYGTTGGFQKAVATSQSYSIPMSMNLDTVDAGYKLLKDAALNATTKTVEWYRETPEMTTTGAPEYHSGVAFVTDFSEDIQAGNVATVSFTLTGYGAYTWSAETDA